MTLMKILEINEKHETNQGGVLTKLLIFQLLSAIENQTWFYINAKI